MSTGSKIVLGSIVYFLWKAYNDITKIKIWFDGIKLRGIQDGVFVLRAVLGIKNPTVVSVPVDKITGKIYIQGIEVGEVNHRYNGSIRAKSTTKVPIDILCDTATVALSVLENIKSGDVSTLTVTFDGAVTIKGFEVPYSTTIGWSDIAE